MTAFSIKELTEQVAPQLLDELALILGRHKWGKKRRVPGGIEDLLAEPWKALSAGREGAEQARRSSRPGESHPERASSRRESASDGRKECRPPVKGGAAARERKEGENGSSKRRKHKGTVWQRYGRGGALALSSTPYPPPSLWISVLRSNKVIRVLPMKIPLKYPYDS